MHVELTQPGPLLDTRGYLAQVGWSRQPLLDCNLENARFYALRPLQLEAGQRRITVDWPGYHEGRGIQAEIVLTCPQEHDLIGFAEEHRARW